MPPDQPMPGGDYVRLRVVRRRRRHSRRRCARTCSSRSSRRRSSARAPASASRRSTASCARATASSRSTSAAGRRDDVHDVLPGRSPSPSPPTSRAAAPSAQADGRETILLVEDEDAVRVIISAVLRRQGYQVLEASTPRGACDIFEQHARRDRSAAHRRGDAGDERSGARAAAGRPSGPSCACCSSRATPTSPSPLDAENPNIGFLSKPFQASVLANKVKEMPQAAAPRGR